MLYDAELRTSCDRSPIVITFNPIDVVMVKPVSVPSVQVMLTLVPEAQSDEAVTTRSTHSPVGTFVGVGCELGTNVGWALMLGTDVGPKEVDGS